MDHLLAMGVTQLAVNTHHAAEAYREVFPEGSYRENSVHFRHEDPVLETGGGIRNLADWLGDEPFWVYNGDILSDLPLERALETHRERGNLVTLVLRSSGGPGQVAWDPQSGLVTDIRNQLGTNPSRGYLFTGIYLIDPAFLREIPLGEKISVVPIWLRLIQAGARIGGILENRGEWWDLGTRTEVLRVHRELPETFPAFPVGDPEWRTRIHPTAQISPGALVRSSVIGAGATVSAGCQLEDSILWPGAELSPGTHLTRCIVRAHSRIAGEHVDEDL